MSNGNAGNRADRAPLSAAVSRIGFGVLSSEHYPFLPAQLIMWDGYPSIELVASIDAPLLVIAGSADSIVPMEQSEGIYRAAAQPERLLVIDGADHNDFELLAGADPMEAITEFLAQLL